MPQFITAPDNNEAMRQPGSGLNWVPGMQLSQDPLLLSGLFLINQSLIPDFLLFLERWRKSSEYHNFIQPLIFEYETNYPEQKTNYGKRETNLCV